MFFNLLLARKNTLFTGPYQKKKPKTSRLFNQVNTSRALWLSWKLCDFGSRRTQFEFHRSQLFISVSLFFLKVRTAKNFKVFHMNGDGFRTCAPVKSIKTSQKVFIGFKNFPTSFYRELKTSGQIMCSNGRLAIETSIKSLNKVTVSFTMVIKIFPGEDSAGDGRPTSKSTSWITSTHLQAEISKLARPRKSHPPLSTRAYNVLGLPLRGLLWAGTLATMTVPL